jgi:hypothetical protein
MREITDYSGFPTRTLPGRDIFLSCIFLFKEKKALIVVSAT